MKRLTATDLLAWMTGRPVRRGQAGDAPVLAVGGRQHPHYRLLLLPWGLYRAPSSLRGDDIHRVYAMVWYGRVLCVSPQMRITADAVFMRSLVDGASSKLSPRHNCSYKLSPVLGSSLENAREGPVFVCFRRPRGTLNGHKCRTFGTRPPSPLSGFPLFLCAGSEAKVQTCVTGAIRRPLVSSWRWKEAKGKLNPK